MIFMLLFSLGVALTCFALVAATVGIKTGNRAYANNMFRLRGTLLILCKMNVSLNVFCDSCCSRFHCDSHGGRLPVLSTPAKEIDVYFKNSAAENLAKAISIHSDNVS